MIHLLLPTTWDVLRVHATFTIFSMSYRRPNLSIFHMTMTNLSQSCTWPIMTRLYSKLSLEWYCRSIRYQVVKMLYNVTSFKICICILCPTLYILVCDFIHPSVQHCKTLYKTSYNLCTGPFYSWYIPHCS